MKHARAPHPKCMKAGPRRPVSQVSDMVLFSCDEIAVSTWDGQTLRWSSDVLRLIRGFDVDMVLIDMHRWLFARY